MAKIKFEDGTIVNFNGNPTPEDVDFVAKQLNIQPSQPKKEGFLDGIVSDAGKRVGQAKRIYDENITQPSNKGQINNPLKTIQGSFQMIGQVGAGMVTDVIGRAAAPIIAPVVKPIVKGVSAFNKVVGGPTEQDIKYISDSVKSFSKKNPNLSADIEATFNLASLYATYKVAQGTGKLVDKGVAKVNQMTGKVPSEVSNSLRAAGKEVNSMGYGMTEPEARATQNFNAKTSIGQRLKSNLTGKPVLDESGKAILKPTLSSDVALEQGLVGTKDMIGTQANKAQKEIWNKVIEPALKKADDIPAQPVWNKVELYISTAERTEQPGLQKAYALLKESYPEATFSAIEAQNIKKNVRKFLANKMFQGEDVSAPLKELKYQMGQGLEEGIYSVVPNNVKTSYLTYGKLVGLKEMGVKAMTNAGMKGGFGKFLQNIWSESLTPVATIGGQVLYRSASGLEFMGKAGIKTISDLMKYVVKPSAKLLSVGAANPSSYTKLK